MGLIMFVAYYVMMTAGVGLGESGGVHPIIGLWVPNLLFGTAGVVMLVRSANEKPLYWMEPLRAMGGAIIKTIARLVRRLAHRAR